MFDEEECESDGESRLHARFYRHHQHAHASRVVVRRCSEDRAVARPALQAGACRLFVTLLNAASRQRVT